MKNASPITRRLSLLRRCKLCARVASASRTVTFRVAYVFFRFIRTPFSIRKNAEKRIRFLEVGPGASRIAGFETFSVVPGPDVDYVGDASDRLPFPDQSFDLIYASHVLEHIPWYQTEASLREWIRILKSGGRIEIWVPDAVKICQAFVDAERHHELYIDRDGWYRFNEEKDPCVWASGRLFSYGDGSGRRDDPNWHRAVFSVRYLQQLLERLGIKEFQVLDRSQVRGYDHGWINLGVSGVKK